jgi:mono/diheme cytochrome c family protein
MKFNKHRFLLMIFITAVCSFCATPKGAQMQNLDGTAPEFQTYVKAHFPKGAELFKKNCSGCHGVFTKGRDSVPNFTKIQMDSYNLAFLQGDTTNHAVAMGISQEEFELIALFFAFRKQPE